MANLEWLKQHKHLIIADLKNLIEDLEDDHYGSYMFFHIVKCNVEKWKAMKENDDNIIVEIEKVNELPDLILKTLVETIQYYHQHYAWFSRIIITGKWIDPTLRKPIETFLSGYLGCKFIWDRNWLVRLYLKWNFDQTILIRLRPQTDGIERQFLCGFYDLGFEINQGFDLCNG